MTSSIEDGLEVIEDPNRLPVPCVSDNMSQKEDTQEYSQMSSPPGRYQEYYTDNLSAAYAQGIKPIAEPTVLPQHKQRVCRFSPALFGLVTALTAALIVGAAVGGGLGSVLAHEKKKPPTTVTITAPASTATNAGGKLTNYTVPSPTTISSVALDCPNIDGNTYNTSNGQSWALSCHLDEYTGDLGAILAYTYQDCIEACAAMNKWQGEERVCSRVQFSSLVAEKMAEDWGNCWLKNGSAYQTSPEGRGVSAKLVDG